MVVQDDRFDVTNSVTMCAFTTDPIEAPLFRLLVQPTPLNGLWLTCRLMVDKITTVPKTKLGVSIGHLDDEDVVKLNRMLVVFLGLATAKSRTVA